MTRAGPGAQFIGGLRDALWLVLGMDLAPQKSVLETTHDRMQINQAIEELLEWLHGHESKFVMQRKMHPGKDAAARRCLALICLDWLNVG